MQLFTKHAWTYDESLYMKNVWLRINLYEIIWEDVVMWCKSGIHGICLWCICIYVFLYVYRYLYLFLYLYLYLNLYLYMYMHMYICVNIFPYNWYEHVCICIWCMCIWYSCMYMSKCMYMWIYICILWPCYEMCLRCIWIYDESLRSMWWGVFYMAYIWLYD